MTESDKQHKSKRVLTIVLVIIAIILAIIVIGFMVYGWFFASNVFLKDFVIPFFSFKDNSRK